MSLTDWIAAELAADGLRLAGPQDTVSWLEPTSAGLVLATDAEITPDAALIDYARGWDRTALRSRLASVTRCPHVTPTMIYDIWRDGCTGPSRAAGLLRDLPAPERARLEVGYWNLLRQKRHDIPLVEVRIAFELALIWGGA